MAPSPHWFFRLQEEWSVRRYGTIAVGLLKKEEERRMPNRDFFTSRGAYVNCAIIAVLTITLVVFKMHDNVPSASYFSVCNVLRQWSISLTPTYRVYRLYDLYVRSCHPYHCKKSYPLQSSVMNKTHLIKRN